MRLSTLPPLVVALALIFGAATQYPGDASAALAAVGFVVTGVWLTLEIASEVFARADRLRAKEERQDSA